MSLFLNLSQTFDPVSGADDQGTPWKNQVGEIKEVGAKFELFDDRLVATMSYFDLTLDNFIITIVDPLTGVPTQRQEGANKTKGFELDMAWQATEELTLLLGVGDIESVNESGIRVRGVSQGINYRGVARYAFTSGPARGRMLGLATSSRTSAPAIRRARSPCRIMACGMRLPAIGADGGASK